MGAGDVEGVGFGPCFFRGHFSFLRLSIICRACCQLGRSAERTSIVDQDVYPSIFFLDSLDQLIYLSLILDITSVPSYLRLAEVFSSSLGGISISGRDDDLVGRRFGALENSLDIGSTETSISASDEYDSWHVVLRKRFGLSLLLRVCKAPPYILVHTSVFGFL